MNQNVEETLGQFIEIHYTSSEIKVDLLFTVTFSKSENTHLQTKTYKQQFMIAKVLNDDYTHHSLRSFRFTTMH